MIGAMYEYEDLQEPYIEFKGRRISKKEADAILDEIVVNEAKRLIDKRKA